MYSPSLHLTGFLIPCWADDRPTDSPTTKGLLLHQHYHHAKQDTVSLDDRAIQEVELMRFTVTVKRHILYTVPSRPLSPPSVPVIVSQRASQWW